MSDDSAERTFARERFVRLLSELIPLHVRRTRLAKLLSSLNDGTEYTMSRLHITLTKLRAQHAAESETFDVGMDLPVYLFRLGWIKRCGRDLYHVRIPGDGRPLSLPPPPHCA